jgi:hypothetical protein
MSVSRRSFIKFLSSIALLGPLSKLSQPEPETVYFDEVLPLRPDGIDGSSSIEEAEEPLFVTKKAKNPLFTGKMGIYQGVSIHEHR